MRTPIAPQLLSLAVLLAILTTAPTSNAQSNRTLPGLAPTTASQLVILDGGPSAQACSSGTGFQREFRIRMLPDATTQPFSVPADQVLVLTGLNWLVVNDDGASRFGTLELAHPPQPAFNTVFTFVAPVGVSTITVPINGVVVGPGSVLCLYAVITNGSIAGNVTGWLAPNR
jgi:hypothetical protein